VAQLLCERADAKAVDDFGMGFHNPQLVRNVRTAVKVDCVQPSGPNGGMAGKTTIGARLSALRARADLTMDEIATAAEYKGRSSVQRYFDRDYDPEFLPYPVAMRLVKALAGKGDPAISDAEVLALAGVNAAQSAVLFAPPRELEQRGPLPVDVPIYGTALGGRLEVNKVDGTGSLTVEQTELDTSEVLGYMRRPPALQGRKTVYGVYVSGMSMFPRFSDGEPALVDPKLPLRIGDDVVVQLKGPDEHDGERVAVVLIKRLVRRNSDYIELEQFNPALTFRVPRDQVKEIHRIIRLEDILT
jgi:hypothetical protein